MASSTYAGGGAVSALRQLAGGFGNGTAKSVNPQKAAPRSGRPDGATAADATGRDSSAVQTSDLRGGLSQDLDAVAAMAARSQDALRPVLKATAAAVTLGTGASLGPEGPSVEIGTAAAQALGSVLRSERKHYIALIAAGSGAGVAAGFNAPISGVFFAVETVLRRQPERIPGEDAADASGLTVAMVLLACVLAAVVSQAGLGAAPAFRVPEYELRSLYELPLFLLFGVLCGAVSAFYTYGTKVSLTSFERLEAAGVNEAFLPIMGGALTGLAAVAYPEILYQGFSNVNAILQGGRDFPPSLLLQILGVKIVTTAVCKGSGLVGGIYAPSIFMGATMGTAFGCLAAASLQPLGIALSAPQVYALVGVAAMLAANCRVPLTSVLLLFELTRDYFIILPTLGAVGLSYWAGQYCLRSIAEAARPSDMLTMSPGELDARPEPSMNADADPLAMNSVMMSVDTQPQPLPQPQTQSAARHASDASLVQGLNGSSAARKEQRRAATALIDGGPSPSMDALTAACAVEEACAIIDVNSSLETALSALSESKQAVGVVLGSDGAVVGVVTRESVLRAMRASSDVDSSTESIGQ